MVDRERVLGFKPQRETPYNALLPYSNLLDAESNDQLAQIKANLARVVQLRDIKIGGSHWTGQLATLVDIIFVRPAIGLMPNKQERPKEINERKTSMKIMK